MDGDLCEWNNPAVFITNINAYALDLPLDGVKFGGNRAIEIGKNFVIERRRGSRCELDLDRAISLQTDGR